MGNHDSDAARRYHDGTKHSVASLQAHRHYLDWEIKPRPFKIYPCIEPIPLPRELPPSPMAALRAIAVRDTPAGDQPRAPGLAALARVLHFSAGITRKKVYPDGQEYHFRAAACTGALYHIDLYVICADLPELPAGVYHFGPHNFALHRLRAGDYRSVLVEASGAEPSVRQAPVIIACASTYWRNSWKYQARTYRHCFWDCGTILANLLGVAAADALPATIVCGFADETVGALLGLDARREGPLALVTLGEDPRAATTARPAVPPLSLETLPLSAHEVDYPAIRGMQAASSLQTAEEVKAWRVGGGPPDQGTVALLGEHTAAGAQRRRRGMNSPAEFLKSPLKGTPTPANLSWPLLGNEGLLDPTADSIDQVILRRGSARRFARQAISFAQLSTMLHSATRGVLADYGGSSSDLYLIVNAVDGLPPGAYVYRRDAGALEQLRAGDFRRAAGFLGLGQELPADASVNFYLLCDLEPVLACFGNRGYRVAQLDAAITGGKLYLAAYALRLGATGLTFFDDDVTDFFSPHAVGKSVMFLVAVGAAKKALPQVA